MTFNDEAERFQNLNLANMMERFTPIQIGAHTRKIRDSVGRNSSVYCRRQPTVYSRT